VVFLLAIASSYQYLIGSICIPAISLALPRLAGLIR
jgi:hypothetical protein